jgi:uncharacterized protein YrzB (UPF0473 family)
MENEFSTIVLKDDEGNEIEFELIMKFDIEEDEYVIVAPVDDEDADAVALKIEKDANGEDIFVTIEDEQEFEMVSEAYETLMMENENLN